MTIMTNEERAREAAEKMLIDLSDRSGMNLLDQIRWDDPDLWKEIIGDGSAIILAALNAATAEHEAELGKLRELLVKANDRLSTYSTIEGTEFDICSEIRSALAKKDPSNV